MIKASIQNNWRPDGGYFICDQCGQRWRRSQMFIRWDNLRVDAKCNDPRPPQMSPPDIYPEGMPFEDARPPQDNPDALVDGSALQSVTGGIIVAAGVLPTYDTGQGTPYGGKAPMPILSSPADAPAQGLTPVATRAIRTGPVRAGGEE